MKEGLPHIIVLGRPGSGKSTVCSLLEEIVPQRLPQVRLVNSDDFTQIIKILDLDKDYKRHVLKDGGFDVVDAKVFDEALARINDLILSDKNPNNLHLVQFATNPYSKSLRNFSSKILRNSLILHVDCPFSVCLKRNNQRENLSTEENHVVPENIMKKFYLDDDLKELIKEKFCRELILLKNDNLSQTKANLETFVDHYLIQRHDQNLAS